MGLIRLLLAAPAPNFHGRRVTSAWLDIRQKNVKEEAATGLTWVSTAVAGKEVPTMYRILLPGTPAESLVPDRERR
jgi:hypothetical protein